MTLSQVGVLDGVEDVELVQAAEEGVPGVVALLAAVAVRGDEAAVGGGSGLVRRVGGAGEGEPGGPAHGLGFAVKREECCRWIGQYFVGYI